MQLIIQSTLEIRRAKKPTARPVMMAPIMLVAAKVMPKRRRAVIIVPATPTMKIGTASQMHLRLPPLWETDKRTTAGYTTLMPKSTQKNAAVGAITAKKRKNAAMMATITLAVILMMVQVLFLSQQQFNICVSPPISVYSKEMKCVKKVNMKIAFCIDNTKLHNE